MPYDTGGGGGRAGSATQGDQFSFDQPYEIGSQFTAETAHQINEMFRILFKSLKRGEAKINTVDDRIDALSPAQWTTIVKAADYGVPNAGQQNDNELLFTVPANKTAYFRFFALTTSVGGGGGIALGYQIGYSGTEANAAWWDSAYTTTLSTAAGGGVGLPSTERTATQSAGVTEDGFFRGYGAVKANSSAATLSLKWRGGTASGSSFTVHKGSWLEYYIV